MLGSNVRTMLSGLYSAAKLFRRRLHVYVFAAYARYIYFKNVSKAEKERDPELRKQMIAKSNADLSRLVGSEMVKLGGLWVKLGQFLSVRNDLLPEECLKELSTLQDKLPSRPRSEIRRILSRALKTPRSRIGLGCIKICRCRRGATSVEPASDGTRSIASGPQAFTWNQSQIPCPDVFTSFDWGPLATASIAQVHRATLKDGREVAVKVRHRDVAEFKLDACLAQELLHQAANKEPRLQELEAALEEWCLEVCTELDFVHEATNLERVASSLGAAGLGVRVPKIVREPAALEPKDSVLVMEFVEGNRPTEAAAAVIKPNKLMTDLSAAFARQVFVDGFFHADPHPGNILIERRSGQIFLLDFGLTKEVSRDTQVAFARLLVATTNYDFAGLLGALQDLGLEGLPVVDNLQRAMGIARSVFWNVEASVDTPPANSGVVPDGSEVDIQHDQLVSESDPEPCRKHVPPQLDSKDACGVGQSTTELETSLSLKPPNISIAEHAVATFQHDLDDFAVVVEERDTPFRSSAGSVLYLFKVAYCLRAIARSLGIRYSCLEAMYPFARQLLMEAACLRCQACVNLHAAVAPSLQARLSKRLCDMAAEGLVIGVAVCIFYRGQVVANCVAGEKGPANPSPVDADTFFPIFNCGKAVSAILMHCLINKKILDPTRRVSDYWPQFGCQWKAAVTVRRALEHGAGISSFNGGRVTKVGEAPQPLPLEDLCNWNVMVEHLARAKLTERLDIPPKEHGLSYGWLTGGLAERVCGASYPVLLQDYVLEPLGLRGCISVMQPPDTLGVGKKVGSPCGSSSGTPANCASCDVEGEVSVLDAFDDDDGGGSSNMKTESKPVFASMIDPRLANHPRVKRCLIPAFNTQATAFGMATLFDALAGDGSVDGRGRILSETYCRQLQSDLREGVSDELGRTAWPHGFRQLRSSDDRGSRTDAFGIAGGRGSCVAFCDPRANLTVAMLSNQICEKPVALKAIMHLLEQEFPDIGELAISDLGLETI